MKLGEHIVGAYRAIRYGRPLHLHEGTLVSRRFLDMSLGINASLRRISRDKQYVMAGSDGQNITLGESQRVASDTHSFIPMNPDYVPPTYYSTTVEAPSYTVTRRHFVAGIHTDPIRLPTFPG